MGVYFLVSSLIILILTIFGLSLEIITCIWYYLGVDISNFIYMLVAKITSSYYMIWSGLFLVYLMRICDINSKKIRIFEILLITFFAIILILPVSFSQINNTIIRQGLSRSEERRVGK